MPPAETLEPWRIPVVGGRVIAWRQVLSEGSTIGAYRVLHKLGAGGMGVVYVGEHTLLGRRAAIKILLPELSAHKEIVHRFFNEAKAVTQIADPGIVQVFDFGYDQVGSAFIIMELLEGEPLDKRLQRVGWLPPVDAVRLMRLISTSLHVAHVKGIIHRDLKPENIFVVSDPAVTGGERPKILDFGIAKLSHDEPGVMKTRTGMVMGTPVYMSPEQCRGAGEVDHRSDIYSIGCVMMTMLTGRPPFEGSGTGELIVAQMQARPPLASSRIPGLPPILDQILQRCLAKDPGQRFATMTDLAQALGHAEHVMMYATPSAQSADHARWGSLPPPDNDALSGKVPNGYTAPPLPVQATTLSSLNGSKSTQTSRRRVSVALVGLSIAGVAAATLVVTQSRGGGTASPATMPADSETAVSSEQVLRGPASAVPTPDAAPVAAVVNATVDAGAIDATAIVESAPDAGVPAAKYPKPPKHTSGSIDHGRPTGPGSASTVDRGD